MTRTRTLISFAVVAASLALASCGSSGAATLDLSYADSATRDSAKGEAASDSPLVDLPASTYEWGGGDKPEPGSDVAAWKFTVPGHPSGPLGEVASVLFGRKTRVIPSQGQVGAYEAGTSGEKYFTSYGDDRSRWWYWVSGSGQTDAIEPCAPDAAGAGKCGPVAVPDPPTDLPSDADAVSKAKNIVNAILPEIADGAVTYTVSRSPYSVSVFVPWTFRGLPTTMGWSFSFGSGSELVNAGGPLFGIEEAGKYPMITVDTAIDRLNNGLGWSYPVSYGGMTKDVATSAAGKSGPEALPSSSSVSTGSAETVTTVAGTVTVTAAEESMVQWWTGKGTQMLLPAWKMSLSTGGDVLVVAVPDKYVTFRTADSDTGDSSDPGASGEGSSGSSSGSSGSGGGATEPAPAPDVSIAAADAEKLVGLSEDEALKVATGNGWKWRVITRDGKNFQVTMDWVGNRVNVEITKGTVTAVKVG